MIHKVIISWDDEDLDEAPTWEDFVREYILDEMHGCIEDMDLSMETINHAHGIVDKIMCHLNRYAEPVTDSKWIGGELGYCTACGHEGCASDIWDGCTGMYCPNCGAKMDAERKEERKEES